MSTEVVNAEIDALRVSQAAGVGIPNKERFKLEIFVTEKVSGLKVEVDTCCVLVDTVEGPRVLGGSPQGVDAPDS